MKLAMNNHSITEVSDDSTKEMMPENNPSEEVPLKSGRLETQSTTRIGDQNSERSLDPFLRAANEDDDGYDPYSDRLPVESMWEEDPWR